MPCFGLWIIERNSIHYTIKFCNFSACRDCLIFTSLSQTLLALVTRISPITRGSKPIRIQSSYYYIRRAKLLVMNAKITFVSTSQRRAIRLKLHYRLSQYLLICSLWNKWMYTIVWSPTVSSWITWMFTIQLRKPLETNREVGRIYSKLEFELELATHATSNE